MSPAGERRALNAALVSKQRFPARKNRVAGSDCGLTSGRAPVHMYRNEPTDRKATGGAGFYPTAAIIGRMPPNNSGDCSAFWLWESERGDGSRGGFAEQGLSAGFASSGAESAPGATRLGSIAAASYSDGADLWCYSRWISRDQSPGGGRVTAAGFGRIRYTGRSEDICTTCAR